MAPSVAAPPALQQATRNSTAAWQDDLTNLFHNAKERFSDVVWELVDDHRDDAKRSDEVWGHKAVVYARAPPSFQARYFSFKPPPATSPLPYAASPTGTLPAQSALSLTLGVDFTSVSRSPSPFRAPSPSPSTNGAMLRLPIPINPTLFSNELEYLYTGKGLGQAFEFLFDSSESREEGDGDEARIDKLRKDFVFMWRSRLYSDVRIALSGNFSSSNHDNATAIFSSHRFILVSRSPYFYTQLVNWGVDYKPGEPLTLTLPSPPFTPASLHFTLGFIYTGTLIFSHRTFDLDTAFHIMRSAAYLSLDTLYDEIQARIVQEMMHGLFHAFLEFSEYESITGGKWGTGGCRCRQCARRAPRVLEFALLDDVKNPHLERGARRALVGLFGEGWCTSEFAHLPQKTRDSLLKGLQKRTTPLNIFPLLFAAQNALSKLGTNIETWAETSKEMILAARKTIDDVLCTQADQCFEQSEWLDIMEADGVRFEDGERGEQIMEAIRRGMNEKNAAMLYQTIVSSILLRAHLTEAGQTMLSSTSHVRIQVEQVRTDIVRWLRRRWVNVKQENGFDGLDPWAAQELAQEIEVEPEDLYNHTAQMGTPRGGTTKGGLRSSARGDDNDTASMHSLRTGVLSRNNKNGDTLKSSASSVRSIARSTFSTTSRTSVATTARRVVHGQRPDSKLTPGHSLTISSAHSSVVESEGAKSPGPTPKPSLSPSTASVRSTHSQASTIRKSTAGPSTLRPPSSLSRPSSTMSTSSDVSTAFETAKSELTPSSAGRTRRGSVASTVSTASVRTTNTTTTSPRVTRPRPPSSIPKPATPSVKTKRPAPSPSPIEHSRLSPMTKRTASSTNNGHSLPSSPDGGAGVKGKSRIGELASHKLASPVTPGSASPLKESLKRKSSSDTITESMIVDVPPKDAAGLPRGATLDIGIPCIISSKKARFRAYAREAGPWVGVEVPMNDNGRQWNDGTWGGIRYFDIGSASEWDDGDGRVVRRRGFDWVSGLGKSSLKREGDQLNVERAKRLRSASPAVSDMSNSESRGLFVRPQQVLYVVDAVGSDL
ncbi:hypothetical protein B0H21DRAFT_768556 [Amylocystis lapponica]|nr:hypothetical protein B0H21DRAFT_768556 [Amylocystis lapponica]